MLPYSDCPAANFHTDDLVPAGYPGMRLTTAEAQQVEETLAPVLPEFLGSAQIDISLLLSCLHPIPASAVERSRWASELQGQASAYWHQLTDKREDYITVLKAFKKQDWTSLLMLFTVPTGTSPKVRPHQPSLQPLREALDERRLKLRREFAERLGCTCLNAPIKLDNLPEVTARLQDKAPPAEADAVPTQRKRVPFGSYIDPELHKELRVACATDDTEIRDALDEALRLWMVNRGKATATD
ncbi:hypothetical protein B0E38_06476 [Streptomyces sp. 111WW2]|uniref:hypothetical protein n=1 Tax=Streptomyces sp. 111WW2 TaxID=1945515 RepID=UPI000D0C8BD5|nr:hypothetical protein [Streptomyces sp. 111WW2]PSK47999.1 hypothetical protein B0E38_06476 [Streptomyces sp. 111WW2]